MTFARWLFAGVLIAAPGLAQAQEGTGCGAFKWPLDHERAALTRADKASLPNGGALAYDAAMTLELQPFSSAGLPKAPERAPKAPSVVCRPLCARRAGQGWRLQGDNLLGRLGRRPRRRRLSCIRSAFLARRNAKACARASNSTCRLARSRFNSAASRRIKSPLSFRPTNSPSLSGPSRSYRASSGAWPNRGVLAISVRSVSAGNAAFR